MEYLGGKISKTYIVRYQYRRMGDSYSQLAKLHKTSDGRFYIEINNSYLDPLFEVEEEKAIKLLNDSKK